MEKESPLEVKLKTTPPKPLLPRWLKQYFGYSLYSVFYTVDPNSITTYDKTLQNEIFDSILSDIYITTPT